MTRLRVAVETQFGVGTPTGLGVYAKNLVRALRLRPDMEVVELVDPSFDLWRFDRRLWWDQVRAPALAAKARADVMHFTGGTLPFRVRGPVVLTVHDLVWLRGANRGRPYVRWYFGTLQAALARRADAILVDTEAARADVSDGLACDRSRIFVAGAGVDEGYFGLLRRPETPPFALCVGTVEERKELATAVEALARVPGLSLISVGPLTPYAQEVRRAAQRCGVADRVKLLGFVSEAVLNDLYERAALLAFPSRYEGFGLPPLQALACGLPVAASDIPVLREVLGDCAWYAPPKNAEAFAAAFSAILAGGTAADARCAAGRERAKTFSWRETARRVADVYRSVAASRTRPPS